MMSCRRGGGLPLLALLGLAAVVLVLAAHGAAGQQLEHAEADSGDIGDDHMGDDLLKGIIGDEGDDDAALGDDDDAHFDDFDFDEDPSEGVGLHNYEDDHTGHISAEEEAQWREEETRFFNAADESKDGFLDEHEYVRAMMKEMDPNMGHAPDEWEGEEDDKKDKENKIAAAHSPALSGTGPLSTEGMSDDEKAHFEELGHQFKEEDLDNDGKISLEEWLNIMFHDEPQDPEFEEGMENLWDHHGRHALTPEEQEEMLADAKEEFNATDTNKDGRLSPDEIYEFVKGPGVEEEEDGADEPISPQEMESMSKELFKELDRDLDGAVTFEEFYKAHYEEPPLAHDYHALHDMPDHPDDMEHEGGMEDELGGAQSLDMGALDDSVADQ